MPGQHNEINHNLSRDHYRSAVHRFQHGCYEAEVKIFTLKQKTNKLHEFADLYSVALYVTLEFFLRAVLRCREQVALRVATYLLTLSPFLTQSSRPKL
jgi:hypothetical protein